MSIYGAMIDTPVLLGGIYQATKAPQVSFASQNNGNRLRMMATDMKWHN
jgi:hypothetical protein